jgi:tRNA nucleotidyltransferase (CCA-adding enzyme)
VQEHDRYGHAKRDEDDGSCDQPAPQPSPRNGAWHGGEGKQIAAAPGVVSARDDGGVPGPPANDLLSRLAALPPAGELLDALGDADGVYVVGGAVRDLLRGDSPVDLDLVADRDLAELITDLSGSGGEPARVHDRFGTATIVLDGGRFDLARARRERYPHPGALPEVEPAPIEEDLRRRDFTVNALALGLGGARRGQLLAVPGALDDLATGTLRVLHDESFRDDPTRLLRLARYAGRLGFAPDEHTAGLARKAVGEGALETVSGARLGTELRLMAGEADPQSGLEELHRLALDEQLIPGLVAPDREVLARALELLPGDGDRAALVLATAALAVTPAQLARGLDALAFAAGPRDAILAAVNRAPTVARQLAAARRPSEIAAAAAGAPVEAVALAGALGGAAARAAAQRWLGELRHVGLEINGDDLVAAGVNPGPAIGAGLRAALSARLDGRAGDRDEQLAEALRAARS